MKRNSFLLPLLICVISISATCFVTGCACEHEYVETQVEATCTEEGYNLFTCSKCNDSYKGDKTTPVINHTGIGTCKACGADFDTMWKEFIDKNSEDDLGIVFEGMPAVVLTYDNDYDCKISALSYQASESVHEENIITFAYNSYDKEWMWAYSTAFGITGLGDDITGTAGGSFTEWSSRSSSLNCSMRTGYCAKQSDLLDTIKELYNVILDKANAKLKECGYNFSMANFGLTK